MGKLIDALLLRSPQKGVSLQPVPPAQPVPVAFATEPRSDLSSGSDLSQPAWNAWPNMLDGGFKVLQAWRNSILKDFFKQSVGANYGSESSKALFGFRYRAFTGIGNGGQPIPNPYVPEYNILPAISWHLRVPNPNTQPNTTAQKGPITIQTDESYWPGTGTASLKNTGEVLL